MQSHSEDLGVRTSTYKFGGDTIQPIAIAMDLSIVTGNLVIGGILKVVGWGAERWVPGRGDWCCPARAFEYTVMTLTAAPFVRHLTDTQYFSIHQLFV